MPPALTQDCFGYLGSFVVLYKFLYFFFLFFPETDKPEFSHFSIPQNGILIGISLSLCMTLGSMDILTI